MPLRPFYPLLTFVVHIDWEDILVVEDRGFEGEYQIHDQDTISLDVSLSHLSSDPNANITTLRISL